MPTRKAPRERLIDTAVDLFYDRGLPNVGINEVTDRAGVARMTLYNNFPSKEALALAAFERLADLRKELVERHLDSANTPSASVRAMFDVAEQLATRPRYRGCAFINVAAQEPNPKGPLHALVHTHKNWIRARFRDIVAGAGHGQPDTAAQQLLALWDGAITEAFIQGNIEPIQASRLAAVVLLAASGSHK